MQTFETAKEAQTEADRLNFELIPQQRIAKVYLKFPEKRWTIQIQPFEYEISAATLKEMYTLTPEEKQLAKILPAKLIYMARHYATLEARNKLVPYQGSMTDITKLAAALQRRAKEIPYHNPHTATEKQPPAMCKFIHAITYECMANANIGLCAVPKPDSNLWRHEWKENRNKLCMQGKQFMFRKGEIIRVGKAIVNSTGINDYRKPLIFDNHGKSDGKPCKLIGQLVSIEFTDGTKIEPSGYVLMSDKSGRELFMQPKKNPIYLVRGWSHSQGEYGQSVFADSPVEAAAKVKKVYPDREIAEVIPVKNPPKGNGHSIAFKISESSSNNSLVRLSKPSSNSSRVIGNSYNPANINSLSRTHIPRLDDIKRINKNLVAKAISNLERFIYDPEGTVIFERKLDEIYENFPVDDNIDCQIAYLFRALIWAQAFPYANKRTSCMAIDAFVIHNHLKYKPEYLREIEKFGVMLHKQLNKIPMEMFEDYFETFDNRLSIRIQHIRNKGIDKYMPAASIENITKWLKEKVIYLPDKSINVASQRSYASSHQASNSSRVIGNSYNPASINTFGNPPKTILFFYMQECTHCKSMKKWIDTIPAKVVKIDCNEKPDLAEKHNVQYTPTIIVLGDKKKRHEGEMTKQELIKFIL